MSGLQEQAVQLICNMSDDNVSFLLEIIRRLVPDKDVVADEGIQAFHRLETARVELTKYLPKDFDPDAELEEARAERYGSVD